MVSVLVVAFWLTEICVICLCGLFVAASQSGPILLFRQLRRDVTSLNAYILRTNEHRNLLFFVVVCFWKLNLEIKQKHISGIQI